MPSQAQSKRVVFGRFVVFSFPNKNPVSLVLQQDGYRANQLASLWNPSGYNTGKDVIGTNVSTLYPLLIKLNHISPSGDRREGTHRHAPLVGYFLKAALESQLSCIILWAGR